MSKTVDARSDSFLCALREHGDVVIACKEAGWTKAELMAYCYHNPKFDLTQVEIYLEYIEDTIMVEARKRLERIRLSEMASLAARQGGYG